jgi:mRNA interferase RelE/StbE
VSWQVAITQTAARQIKKLGRTAQISILRFLRDRIEPCDDSRQWGKPLRGEKPGLWRYRVGDYRLICDIQDEKITVVVLEVGDCKNIYR